MALFADGGWIATNPYAASGNYVNKMSDYCKSCEYSVKHKTEDNACPLNSLYWNFIDRHHNKLKQNPRMSFPIKNWEKQDETEKQKILSKAQAILRHLDTV
jgi:deoxyribodipyrimidine photolyase-related protein